jgi:hypothetical protein
VNGPYFKLSERTELTDEERCEEAFEGGDDGVAADAETASTEELETAADIFDALETPTADDWRELRRTAAKIHGEELPGGEV